MNRAILGLVLLCTTPLWSAEEAPKKVLLIPTSPVQQALAPTFQAFVDELKVSSELSQLERWTRLSELPPWVFEKDKREIAFIAPRALVMHDFRYAVIRAGDGTVLVVRAGGPQDRYEIFQTKEANTKPSPAPNAPSPR